MCKKKYKKLKKEIFESLFESTQITDTRIDKINDKIKYLEEKIKHIDERTMALDNVKLNNWIDHTKQIEKKIEILMDRTSTNYNACSDTGITFENGDKIIKCMAARGATKEEMDNVKDYFNRYIFRCRLFYVYKDEVPTPEEIIDGKKEEYHD